jgi:hypothetical protein
MFGFNTVDLKTVKIPEKGKKSLVVCDEQTDV